MFTSPPPSQWALESRSVVPRSGNSTLEPSFCRFFGVSIFDSFLDTILHRCWLPKWTQNGAKIDEKSDFFVDWRCRCFFHVSTCFSSSFFHELLNLRTLISKRPYRIFWCFFVFHKIASRTSSKWFLASRRLQKTPKNQPKGTQKLVKNRIKKTCVFLTFFCPK